MKTTTGISALSLTTMVVLGIWGLASVQSAHSVKTELSAQTRLSQILSGMNESSDSVELTELLSSQQNQLPESARHLAGESAEQLSVEQGITDLYDVATGSTASAEARAQGTQFANELWDFGQKNKLVSNIPNFVKTDPVACDVPDDADEAPPSVKDLAGSANAYLYASQVLAARGVDSASDVLEEVTSLHQELTDAISCTYTAPQRYSAYSFDAQHPEQTLKSLRATVESNAQATVADASVPADSPIFEESIQLLFEG